MSRVFYPVRYHLDNKDRFLIWHSIGADEGKEANGVVNDAGLIPVFQTRQSLLAYAQAEELLPVEENDPAFINLDRVVKWLKGSAHETENIVFLGHYPISVASESATLG